MNTKRKRKAHCLVGIEPRYQSDRVTLYCGDALEILPTMEAGSVDMIFTDPPYGHNNNNGDLISRREQALGQNVTDAEELDGRRPIANDGQEANELFRKVLPEWFRLFVSGGCCFCGGGGPDPQFARWSLWLDEVFDFKQMVVWDKGPIGMGWHYRRSYETVLVAQKPGAACRWFDDSQQIENIVRPGQYGIRKIIPSADQHPTEKPVALAAHFIRLHALPGHLVLDSFMGSGSTGVAALKNGCRFLGIEVDEKHYAIAEKRIRAEEAQEKLF